MELLDLYPTLVEFCGLPAIVALEGVSLVPVLQNIAAKPRQYALSQHPRLAYYKEAPDSMGYSLRSDAFRYTEWRDWNTGEVVARELYDHRVDPGETHNVAAAPYYAKDVGDLSVALEQFDPIVIPGWIPVLSAGR